MAFQRTVLGVKNQYEDDKIPFVVTGVNYVPDRESRSNHFWLLTLRVKSESLRRIKVQLGLERRKHMLNPVDSVAKF